MFLVFFCRISVYKWRTTYSNCSEVRPPKTEGCREVILFPYKTLEKYVIFKKNIFCREFLGKIALLTANLAT